MKRDATIRAHARHAFTLSEVLITMTVLSVVFAATMSASVSLQRTFVGSAHFAQNLGYQSRTIDYILRDFRRAVTVPAGTQIGTEGGNPVYALTLPITIKVPDYYQRDNDGTMLRNAEGEPVPNEPQIVKRSGQLTATYGTATRTIIYSLTNNRLIRSDNGINTILATDVTEFYTRGTRSANRMTVGIKFQPRFRPLKAGSLVDGTAIEGTVLLRNLRVSNE